MRERHPFSHSFSFLNFVFLLVYTISRMGEREIQILQLLQIPQNQK
jgi:hypothetical protein